MLAELKLLTETAIYFPPLTTSSARKSPWNKYNGDTAVVRFVPAELFKQAREDWTGELN